MKTTNKGEAYQSFAYTVKAPRRPTANPKPTVTKSTRDLRDGGKGK